MSKEIPEAHRRLAVSGLIIGQLAILWASLYWNQISPFCTVSESTALQLIGWVHLLFLLILPLGIASIVWRRGRIWYVTLLSFGLCILPVQAGLVQKGIFTCDGF